MIAKKFAAAMHSLMRISSFVATIIISFITLLTVVDVVSRKVYKPIFGVPELTELSMLFICFFTIGYVAFKNREISIELFDPKLPPPAQGLHVWEKKEISAALQMPLFPFYFVITFGAALYCIEMLFRIFRVNEKDS